MIATYQALILDRVSQRNKGWQRKYLSHINNTVKFGRSWRWRPQLSPKGLYLLNIKNIFFWHVILSSLVEPKDGGFSLLWKVDIIVANKRTLHPKKKQNQSLNVISLFFHHACCYRILFKNPTHALCFKIHTKTQSLFKTLECLRLLCHPTCFGHTLDHLQGMFLVQCYFPSCCFVTVLLGYVAVSSICVVVVYTSLLSVLLCTVDSQVYDWNM